MCLAVFVNETASYNEPMGFFEFHIKEVAPGPPPPGVSIGHLGYLWGTRASGWEDADAKLAANPQFDADRHGVASCVKVS